MGPKTPGLIFGLLAAAAVGAAAEPPPSTPASPPAAPAPDPAAVVWTVKPSAAQLAAAWPAEPRRLGVSGAATIECALKAGALTACKVRSEWPKGVGFGAAALKLAPLYRSQGADQAAVVNVEWRTPELEKAETAARGGDYSGIETIPPMSVAWARRPTSEIVGRYYPPIAAEEGTGGSVDLLCLIGLRGAPQNCQIIEETPADLGFGPAAQRGIAPRMEATPLAGDDRPSQGRAVRIKIAFQPARPAPTTTAVQGSPAPTSAVDPAVAAMKAVPWAGGPTPEQLEKAFPPGAKAAGVSGRSSITCTVKATGEMEACKVVSEEPAGAGFGAAALSVAPLFKLKPTTASGRSVAGASITIPLVWTAPTNPGVKPPTPAEPATVPPAAK